LESVEGLVAKKMMQVFEVDNWPMVKRANWWDSKKQKMVLLAIRDKRNNVTNYIGNAYKSK